MKDERIQRIERMEKSFDRAQSSAKKLDKALKEYFCALEDIEALGEYFGGEWREDFEADERGELPHDLKRGVLSEDGLYNLLEDTRELARDMKELAKKLSVV